MRRAGPDALALYVVVKGVYDVYQAEVALQAAYIAAVEAEMDADDDRLYLIILRSNSMNWCRMLRDATICCIHT